MEGSYSFKINPGENRLYVTIKGSLTIDTVEDCGRNFMKEVAKLKPHFTILFDMREANTLEPAGVAKLEPNVKKCVDLGMHKHAYLVNSVITKGQMKRSFGKYVNESDGYFDNIEEAIQFLNK